MLLRPHRLLGLIPAHESGYNLRRDRGAQVLSARSRRPDGVQQLRAAGVFQHIPIRSRIQRGPDVLFRGMPGEHHDPQVGSERAELANQLDARAAGQRNICQNELRLEMAHGEHSRAGIADGADHFQIGLELEQRPQAVTQDGVILYYEKALLRRARRCRGTGVKPVIRGLGRVCGSVGGMSQTSLPC